MYNYDLINNHYIVNVDGDKYLIDTGSPFSFWVSRPIKEITIDGNNYPLHGKPANLDLNETRNLVGVEVDGFIGLDIILKTGLTIYKNGTIEFAVKEIGGTETMMATRPCLMAAVNCNLMFGRFIIDTGAKYGYGIKSVFTEQKPFGTVKDYNPMLGHLESDIYHLDIDVGSQSKTIDVCDNQDVAFTLRQLGAFMIGNVSSLFEEACVLDTKKGRLIIK